MPVGHAEHVSELDCWKAAEKVPAGHLVQLRLPKT